jgi:hypothetical protein
MPGEGRTTGTHLPWMCTSDRTTTSPPQIPGPGAAYQPAIDAGHPDIAPHAAFDLERLEEGPH